MKDLITKKIRIEQELHSFNDLRRQVEPVTNHFVWDYLTLTHPLTSINGQF